MRFRIGTLLLILVQIKTAHAAGTTYYVSAGNGSISPGNDNNTCTQARNIGSPKKTLNNAVACLGSGDTLLVRGGTYTENLTSVPSGDSWTSKVRIAAYPNGCAPGSSCEAVWLKPTSASPGGFIIWLDGAFHYIEFDGINLDGAASSQADFWFSTNNGNDPHHIRYKNAEVVATPVIDATIQLGAHTLYGATGGFELQNLNIHGGASYGIYLMSPNALIEGNYIHDVGTTAIMEWNPADADPPNNNIIRNNIVTNLKIGPYYDHKSMQPGISGFVIAGADTLIYNNLIYQMGVPLNTTSGGVHVYLGPAKNNKIFNNTIVGNNAWGVYLDNWNGTAPSNTEIRNNIFYGNTSGTIADNGTATAQSNNLSDADPLFVNPDTGDFHLRPGSPAINAGVTTTLFTTDFTGAARTPPYDIGAYEYGSVTSSCDVNGDAQTNVLDAQGAVNQALVTANCLPAGQPGSADINQDGQCTVVDVQRVVNAALGGSCVTTP